MFFMIFHDFDEFWRSSVAQMGWWMVIFAKTRFWDEKIFMKKKYFFKKSFSHKIWCKRFPTRGWSSETTTGSWRTVPRKSDEYRKIRDSQDLGTAITIRVYNSCLSQENNETRLRKKSVSHPPLTPVRVRRCHYVHAITWASFTYKFKRFWKFSFFHDFFLTFWSDNYLGFDQKSMQPTLGRLGCIGFWSNPR